MEHKINPDPKQKPQNLTIPYLTYGCLNMDVHVLFLWKLFVVDMTFDKKKPTKRWES